jgi:hypothetical protein
LISIHEVYVEMVPAVWVLRLVLQLHPLLDLIPGELPPVPPQARLYNM